MKPVDQENRLAALDPLHSVCVTAPAGSGKTELLSQRVLTLLARVEKPEQLLAITFTRKAAAEMHHRIIAALQFASESPEPEEGHKQLTWRLAKQALERDEQQGWKLLFNPQRLKIQTIDSLCSSLTRQMPILSLFGAQPRLVDDGEALYREAVQLLLDGLEREGIVADDLAVLLRHLDNNLARVEGLLVSLLGKRDQWLHHIFMGQSTEGPRAALENTLLAVNRDVVQKLSSALGTHAAELTRYWDYAGANLAAENSESPIALLAGIDGLPDYNAEGLLRWQAVAELLLTAGDDWRKSLTKKNGFPTETRDGDKKLAKQLKQDYLALVDELKEVPGLLTALGEVRKLPALAYSEAQWNLLEALTRLLPQLVARLNLIFAERGEVDFSQMSIAALQALGDGLDPSELMMKLDYQLKHILIDEFQDTSSTQYELLKRLVEGWQEHNETNPDDPNTLFIVGDGMQSIYSFREAKVGLFLEARKEGVNGLTLKDLPLSVNFRSTDAVVNWNNQTFDQAFPDSENLSRGAVPYEHSVAFNNSDGPSEVEVFGFTGEAARELEADKTLSLVQEAIAADPEGSIAILVRSRPHLADILSKLSEAGLSWQATDIDPLAGDAAIVDLLSLTKATLNIADEISWASVLRSPLVGLDNQDLFRLFDRREAGGCVFDLLLDEERLAQLSEAGRTRAERFGDLVDNAMVHRGRRPFRSWLQGLWQSLGGVSCLPDSAALDSVMRYFDLLEAHQLAAGLQSLESFERAVSRLFAAPSTEPSQIQVMTIHKSKGLEFDTVILPGLARRPRGNDPALLLWREYLSHSGQGGLLMSPPAAAGQAEDSIYSYLKNELSISQSLENTRLLYVAATRAVKNLYLLFTTDWNEKNEAPVKPGKQTLLYPVWEALEEAIQWQHEGEKTLPQLGFDFDDAAIHQELLYRLPPSLEVVAPNYSNPLEGFYIDRSELEQGNENVEAAEIGDNLPQLLGNIIHRLLQQIAESGPAFWYGVGDDTRPQWLARLMAAENVAEAHFQEGARFITRSIENTLNDEKGRWLLSAEHKRAMTEYEMLSTLNGNIEKRIVDRSFVDEDNYLWIVDYKTAEPQLEESVEAFVDREVTLYRGQLMNYRWLMTVLFGGQQSAPVVRTGLYFTSLGRWQELT